MSMSFPFRSKQSNTTPIINVIPNNIVNVVPNSMRPPLPASKDGKVRQQIATLIYNTNKMMQAVNQ